MAELLIRYFAGARDLAGCSEERVAIEALPVDLGGLAQVLGQRHPSLAAYLERMRFAVNGEFAGDAVSIAAGDEVDVMPPVAGGASVISAGVSSEPLSVDAAMKEVGHPGAGAINVFTGVVRDHHEGRRVVRLDYEAHPSLAEVEMRRILEGIVAEWPMVRVAVRHRVGELAVGDLAIVIAVSAPHRAEAFAACRAAIDRIKETVPIWKKEWDREGDSTWIALEP